MGDLVTCSNPDCNVAETGKCVEASSLDTCEYYGRNDTNSNEIDDESDLSLHQQSGPTLPAAILLDCHDTTCILRANKSHVAAVIGTVDAGKTSLIAALYDCFQRGSLDGLHFAGSSTLHSFELACHDARSKSRRNEAHIFRTPLGDARFYHLDLFEPGSGLTSLIISDRAGEEYQRVANDVSYAENFFEVLRADVVAVLVDGERLADVGGRHRVRSEIEAILQGLLDGGALARRQRIALILTKGDAVRASVNAERALRDFDGIVNDAANHLSASVAELSSFITTASPKVEGAIRGDGLSALIRYFIKPITIPPHKPALIWNVRDFGRLKPVREDA